MHLTESASRTSTAEPLGTASAFTAVRADLSGPVSLVLWLTQAMRLDTTASTSRTSIFVLAMLTGGPCSQVEAQESFGRYNFDDSTTTSRRKLQQTCPPGTTSVYSDEALAFRFRSDGITRAADGSLLWNATTPPLLAFTMTRPEDEYYPLASETDYQGDNATMFSEPATIVPSGVYPGLHFESPESARLARGQESTYIAPGNEGAKARRCRVACAVASDRPHLCVQSCSPT
jgi:hypothetical protein